MDYMQKDYISEIVELVHTRKSTTSLLEALESYHENDIAEALEFLTKEERIALYSALGIERVSEVFAYLEDATEYFEEIELKKAAEIIENMDSDDAVDILENMDEEIGEKLVSLIDEESMHDIRLIQSYEEDEIGSKMTTNFIAIRKGMTVKEAMKELVSQAEENDNIYTVYVYNEDNSFYGAMDLKDLITARAHVDLEDLISHAYPYVHDHEKVSDCLEKIRGYAEDSIPVLDDKNCILGVITAQDIIEGALIEVRQETIITTKRTNSIHTYIPPFVFCNCYFFLLGVDRQWPLTTELPLLYPGTLTHLLPLVVLAILIIRPLSVLNL